MKTTAKDCVNCITLTVVSFLGLALSGGNKMLHR